MSNVTLCNGDLIIRAMLRHSPVTAARNGLLTAVHGGVLAIKEDAMAQDISDAATPLKHSLGVSDLHEVDGALCALAGRPPRVVTRALADPKLITALCAGLDAMGLIDLSNEVARWGPKDPEDQGETVPLSRDDWSARSALVDQLRTRAGELLAAWREQQMMIGADTVTMDGRSIAAAARAWRVPMLTGVVPPLPEASAALHPNRLGRTAAIVAFSRLSSLPRSMAPDGWIFEPLALLVAVGEAISVPNLMQPNARLADSGVGLASWDRKDAHKADHGLLSVRVRAGEPVEPSSSELGLWWPVFESWGSTSKRTASAVPTAWRLSEAEADVLVWALCSVAVRLSVAGSLLSPGYKMLDEWRSTKWEGHVASELPKWEAGARSVWTLMQSLRRFDARTAFPGQLTPSLDSDSSWPWRPWSW